MHELDTLTDFLVVTRQLVQEIITSTKYYIIVGHSLISVSTKILW